MKKSLIIFLNLIFITQDCFSMKVATDGPNKVIDGAQFAALHQWINNIEEIIGNARGSISGRKWFKRGLAFPTVYVEEYDKEDMLLNRQEMRDIPDCIAQIKDILNNALEETRTLIAPEPIIMDKGVDFRPIEERMKDTVAQPIKKSTATPRRRGVMR